MTHLRDLLILFACLLALTVGYALLVRLIRTVATFLNELLEMAVAGVFFVVIAPMVWLWEKGRRPMWRTLTEQQSQELEAWLRRGVGE